MEAERSDGSEATRGSDRGQDSHHRKGEEETEAGST